MTPAPAAVGTWGGLEKPQSLPQHHLLGLPDRPNIASSKGLPEWAVGLWWSVVGSL